MENSKKKRKYCDHCGEYLSARAYLRHVNWYSKSKNKKADQSDVSDDELPPLPAPEESNQESTEDYDNGNADVSDEEEYDGSNGNADESQESWAYPEEITPTNNNDRTFPEIWDLSEEDVNCDFAEECNVPFVDNSVNGSVANSMKSIIRCTLVFLCLWASFCSISDNALDILLSFLGVLMESLGRIIPMTAAFAALLPKTVHMFRSHLGINEDQFVKYVVCPSCCSIYNFDDCYKVLWNGKRVSKLCSHVAFPNHRQEFRRTACNKPLLKEVTLKNGTVRLYPFKVYCYKSVIHTLRRFLQRPTFIDMCELWRNRNIPTGFLADVFDGRVWKEWQFINREPFLASPHNFALMLNVDWFQPFKHSVYSVGALYMVLMNLPRSERFKPENLFLVGIIPGPHEPKLNINSFLQPLVAELDILWKEGVQAKLPQKSGMTTFRAALLCIGCDVPATRKLCGFYACSAANGCSKCTKVFPGNVAAGMDYSGFDPQPTRRNEEHRLQVQEVLDQTSATDQSEVEKRYGVRYSELLQLSYFDAVRFHTIDPMHCLFTGTAKHIMLKIWLNEENPMISKKDLSDIQKKIDNIRAPSNIGRMPSKIENSYGGFTADQWKSWTLLFSIYALWNKLPPADLEVWRNFVMASTLFCSSVITEGRAELAHSYIIQFGRDFETQYGKDRVTPNMHLQTHILDCILDYGPVYSFWLFSFERFNGLLGEYRTNQRAVEIQLIRKFTSDLYVKDLEFPSEFKEVFQPLLERLKSQQAGTLSHQEEKLSGKMIAISLLSNGPVRESNHWPVNDSDDFYQFHPPQCKSSLTQFHLDHLKEAYKAIFPQLDRDSVTRFFDKFASVSIGRERFGSADSRGERSSFITARWCGFRGQIDLTGADIRPGVVDYYIRQNVVVNGMVMSCVLASVRWFHRHTERHLLGAPAEVWCRNQYEADGPASFIPVQRIMSKFIPAFEVVKGERVLVVCPLRRKLEC